MSSISRYVPDFHHESILRLATAPPEPSDAPPINLADILEQREQSDWLTDIFEKYHNMLLWFAYGYAEDYHLAQDVVQEMFLRLTTIDRARITKPKSYLYSMSRSLIRKAYHKQIRQHTKRTADCRHERGPVLVSRAERPIEISEYTELQEKVDQEIAAMGRKMRSRVAVQLASDLAPGERATEHGEDATKIALSVSRGLAKLRERFKDLKPDNKPFKLRITSAPRPETNRMKFYVWCVELQKRFETMQEAADFAKVDKTSLHCALKGKTHTSAGYHWEWRERAPGDVAENRQAQMYNDPDKKASIMAKRYATQAANRDRMPVAL